MIKPLSNPYYKAEVVYQDIDLHTFGPGNNSIILTEKLIELGRPVTIRKLIKKYSKLCTAIGFVETIPDITCREHLKQLLLNDADSYLEQYHFNLPVELKKRFIAAIKRRLKSGNYG